jgi:hypothetical protein
MYGKISCICQITFAPFAFVAVNFSLLLIPQKISA